MPRSAAFHPWLSFALAGAALAAPALASDEPKLGTLTTPKAVERRNPAYPMSAAAQWKEGWVLVSFCIDGSGNAHTPVIERSSGAPEFESASLRAIARWKYEPARLNGEPIEMCDVNVRLAFGMEGIGLGARPKFAKEWRAASKLIDEAKLAEAKTALDAITPHNNYESARMALARSRIAQSTGDTKQQLDHLRMALLQPGSMEPGLRREVRRQVFALELKRRDWGSAYETYEELAEKAAALSEAENKAGAQLASLVTGDQTLATEGELECRCDKANGDPLWSTRLLRREFGFADASGKVDRFDLRCTGHRFAAKFDTTSAWTVPESWGECTLYVFGEEGAKFRLVEMAPQVAAASAPSRSAP